MILERFTIERMEFDHSSPGSWYNSKRELICKTLEQPWRGNQISNDASKASCIPYGIYLVVHQMPGFGRDYEYFRIVHVPGRHWRPDIRMSSILVHPVTYVEGLLGCIGVGSRFVDFNNDGIPDIAESKKKLLWMTQNLPKAFELEIIKKAA